MQPEKTYFCILKVTGQVWKKQKKDKHQHYSQLPPMLISLSPPELT